jgi:hypothetical protein
MSYTISQQPEQIKLAAALQQKSDISNISLIESVATCKAALTKNVLPFSFAVEFQAEEIECEGANLRVTTRFSFKIINDKDKAEVISLRCLLGAEYTLAEGFQPSAEQIKAFKEGPAIFNCWPYFREYVQNTVVRMNYPPPTIPFLWLEVKKLAHAEAIAPKQAESIQPPAPRKQRKAR